MRARCDLIKSFSLHRTSLHLPFMSLPGCPRDLHCAAMMHLLGGGAASSSSTAESIVTIRRAVGDQRVAFTPLLTPFQCLEWDADCATVWGSAAAEPDLDAIRSIRLQRVREIEEVTDIIPPLCQLICAYSEPPCQINYKSRFGGLQVGPSLTIGQWRPPLPEQVVPYVRSVAVRVQTGFNRKTNSREGPTHYHIGLRFTDAAAAVQPPTSAIPAASTGGKPLSHPSVLHLLDLDFNNPQFACHILTELPEATWGVPLQVETLAQPITIIILEVKVYFMLKQ